SNMYPISTIASITFDGDPPIFHGYDAIVLHPCTDGELTLQLWGKEIRVFIDSGAEVNIITQATFQSSIYDTTDLQCMRQVQLQTWTGVEEINVGSILHVPFHYSDQLTISTSFVVLPLVVNLLGLGFLLDTGCKQEWDRNRDTILWVRDENIIHCDVGHIITPGLYMELDFVGVRVHALIDSGAAGNLFSYDLVVLLGLDVNQIPRVSLTDANNQSIKLYGVVSSLIIQVDEHGEILVPNLDIIDNNEDQITLGKSFLKQFNCEIDYENTTLYIQKPNGKYIGVILTQKPIEIDVKDQLQ
ncbi:unnamed protein product, partial [Meganyctiphanes norvegica]